MHLERCAGFLVPLFSLRTADDLGRGEIGGLVPMADLALRIGHRFIQLLPIDETAFNETSPYTALSVLAIDPMYISARSLSGVEPAMFAAARKKAYGARVNYARLGAAKRGLLERAYHFFSVNGDSAARTAFEEFVANNAWVRDYALFRALKEKFRWRGWETWPEGLKRHDPAALTTAGRELAGPIAKYAWFQHKAHQQWLDMRAQLAERGVMVGGDLAFSPGRESVEVWANQEFFDLERSVGAPPDAFSETGQRWGLPMPNWQSMRSSGFNFLRTRVRRARELYDALRIDHVVGLFRTYGYPVEKEHDGAFDPSLEVDQQAQGEEILKVILEEAGRTEIIAEDLGVIPPFVRATLARLAIPGYKVFRWEKEGWGTPHERFLNPASYPEVSLATTGTHDTETLVQWWREISAEERARLAQALEFRGHTPSHSPKLSAHTRDLILESLYASPSRLVVVPTQDLFGWTRRINTPGTVNRRNWSWRLPFEIEQATDRPKVRARVEKIRALATRNGRFVPGQA